MFAFLSTTTFARTYKQPVAWAILLVDVFPVWAVFMLGWGVEPLVFLYWLENLIIGLITLIRLGITGYDQRPTGLVLTALLGTFFVVHYGLFCYVHGVFIYVFASMQSGTDPAFLNPAQLVRHAVTSGPHMATFVMMILGLQMFLLLRDHILTGAYRQLDMKAEMATPYSRIVGLHIALFAGAAALIALNAPLIGILGLIFIRICWGIALTVRRQLEFDAAAHIKS